MEQIKLGEQTVRYDREQTRKSLLYDEKRWCRALWGVLTAGTSQLSVARFTLRTSGHFSDHLVSIQKKRTKSITAVRGAAKGVWGMVSICWRT